MDEVSTLRRKKLIVMRTIKLEDETLRVIKFGRIKPFKNICKVTGVEELCNIVTEYCVGSEKKVIDVVEYRKYFDHTFNELIEDIAKKVYDEIMQSAKPKWLRVEVFLEGNPHLTDWSVEIDSRRK